MQATSWFMTGRPDGAGRSRAPLGELARFLAVAVIGLVVDLAIAWTLAEPFGLPLAIAASAGFAAAAALNYVLHEIWTFQAGHRQISLARAAKYLFALGLTLAVRLVALSIIVRLFPPEGWTLVVLGLATGVSFTANYAASKFLVFTAPAPGARQPETDK